MKFRFSHDRWIGVFFFFFFFFFFCTYYIETIYFRMTPFSIMICCNRSKKFFLAILWKMSIFAFFTQTSQRGGIRKCLRQPKFTFILKRQVEIEQKFFESCRCYRKQFLRFYQWPFELPDTFCQKLEFGVKPHRVKDLFREMQK